MNVYYMTPTTIHMKIKKENFIYLEIFKKAVYKKFNIKIKKLRYYKLYIYYRDDVFDYSFVCEDGYRLPLKHFELTFFNELIEEIKEKTILNIMRYIYEV